MTVITNKRHYVQNIICTIRKLQIFFILVTTTHYMKRYKHFNMTYFYFLFILQKFMFGVEKSDLKYCTG